MAVYATLSAAGDSAGRYTAPCTGVGDIVDNDARGDDSLQGRPTTDSMIGLVQAYLPPNVNGLRDDLPGMLQRSQLCQFFKVNKDTNGGNFKLTTQQAAELTYWARILDPTC